MSRVKWLTFAYAFTLVLLIAAADRGALAISYLAAVPAADKIGHFVLIGLLSYLANTAWDCSRFRWKRFSVLKGSFLVGAFVVIEEVSQLWLTHRAFELADLTADAAGIWVFGSIIARPRQPRH